MRVLIVEDNHDCADSEVMLMREWGHEVQVAYDGTAAFEVAHEFLPEVMLIDIGLPGMDGCALAERVRALPVLRNTKLVAISGYGDHETRQRAEAVGFDEYLLKPTNPLALRQKLVGRWK
jgi:CheY-like chemotaxis protein